jgi:hypothetical protein
MKILYELNYAQLPKECIQDCSRSGDVSNQVKYWRIKLNFQVCRNNAIRCLEGYGAWDDLESASDETIAERVLWLACGDFSEYLRWCEQEGKDPDADDLDPPAGTGNFFLS